MKADRNKNLMQDLRPTVWIGKQGCSDTIIEEISDQLEKMTVVKVKWLQNIEVDPAEVAARAGALLVEVRGRTMILARRQKK
jgi:RNA-binding protein